MQQKSEQMLSGSYGFEYGSLDFSCLKLEINLTGCTIYEGAFTIFSAPGRYTEGYVTTSDLRMECLTPEFTGSSAEISFRFYGEDMAEGDVVKGDFFIVSNQGEYSLPFMVNSDIVYADSSVGYVKNLFHFSNLAKSNWIEAVKIFYEPDFEKVFRGSDRKYYDYYRGLSVYLGYEQNVEEFLIAVQKKTAVEYMTEEEALVMNDPLGVAESIVTVVRNGWGYTFLKILVEGDFLFTEKGVLTDDDFLGNSCRLSVYIDSSMIRAGNNFGRITLYNPWCQMVIPVTVKEGRGRKASGPLWEEKRLLVQLMEFYQAFRLKKIGTQTWLTETEKLVERMVVLDDKNISARLFQAQIKMTQEKYHEAKWLLDHALTLIENCEERPQELWAYYLYLTTLTDREESYITLVAEEVELCYRQDKTRFGAAWLLLYLSADFNRNMSHRWSFLERQIDYGCNSPLIYVEAMLMLNNNPSLLRKLGKFELQVLYFGARQEVLGGEVKEQLLYLAGRVREYNVLLFRIFKKCYEQEEDVRILREICILLIKGGKAGEAYLDWYRQGINKELRITKLYEYYMASVDLDSREEIPRLVLMYFTYQSNLDYEHSAFLYEYIWRNKEELGDLYLSYQARIQRFVIEQIQKEHINRHLAWLYQELLTPGMIGEQTAPALSRLIFANQLWTDNQDIRHVIVLQPGNRQEQVYPVTGNHTWIPIYGSNSTVLLQDAEGGRYIKSVDYTLEKLMIHGKYIRYITPFVKEDMQWNLYLCEEASAGKGFEPDEAGRALWLCRQPQTVPELKRSYCISLLKYFREQDDMRGLDRYLEDLRPGELKAQERRKAFRCLVIRGKYEKAWQWLSDYGPVFADTRSLVQLCSVRLEQTDFVEDKVLSAAAAYVFREGKYDGNILRYLILHFQGLTKEMRDIWIAAYSFDVDYYELNERILLQMLFSGALIGEKMEVLKDYAANGARPEVLEAFLAWCAHDYFSREEVTDCFIFEEIANVYQREGVVSKVCKLAFLKYYAELESRQEETVQEVIRDFLGDMLQEGIHLTFFRNLKGCEDMLNSMQDKTLVEYRTQPGAQAFIHYVILQEDGEDLPKSMGYLPESMEDLPKRVGYLPESMEDLPKSMEDLPKSMDDLPKSMENLQKNMENLPKNMEGEYLKEEMNMVYPGVYYKEFILFFGETLHYYIMESKGEEEELRHSGVIHKDEDAGTSLSRFDLINDITVSRNLQDYDAMEEALMEYYRRVFFNGKLFGIR